MLHLHLHLLFGGPVRVSYHGDYAPQLHPARVHKNRPLIKLCTLPQPADRVQTVYRLRGNCDVNTRLEMRKGEKQVKL